MDQQRIGQFIKFLRKEQELTQQELADKLGVTNRAVSKWENGLSLPDYSIIGELSKLLNVSINEILSGEKLKEEERSKKFEENVMKTIRKNKNLKKSNLILSSILVIIFIAILGGYFGYKIYLLKSEPVEMLKENLNYINNLNIVNDNISNTVSGNTVYDTNYYDVNKQKNISFYIPEGYKVTKNIDEGADPGKATYIKKDSKGDIIGTIKVYGFYGDLTNIDIGSATIGYKEIARLLKKYKINNIIDFVNYFDKNRSVNVLSSIDRIKMYTLIAENGILNVIDKNVTIHTINGETFYGFYNVGDKETYVISIYVTNKTFDNFLKIYYDNYVDDDTNTKEEIEKIIQSIKFDKEA